MRAVRAARCQGEEAGVDAIAIPIDAAGACGVGDPV
jgi:hypothetical protein